MRGSVRRLLVERVTAGEPPSIASVHETRPLGHQRSPGSPVGVRPNGQPLDDDWLGDISDDDWSEHPPPRAERPSPSYEELPSSEGDARHDLAADPGARVVASTEAHRAVIERRRLVAGLVAVVVIALAAVSAVLFLRDGGQATVVPVPASTETTPAPGETRPSAAPTASDSSPTSSSTTPSTSDAFTLPEGTKLQRVEGDGEGDPVLIEELQQALTKAGYDPGPADGTFGRRTEAAVIAFQEANGLSVDGRVGPETASALNSAIAGG